MRQTTLPSLSTTAAALALALGLGTLAPSWAFTTFGDVECATWLAEPTAPRKTWLLGYMSGLSGTYASVRGGVDPLQKVDSAEQIYQWMNDYCRKHRTQRLSEGGVLLLAELLRKK